MASLVALALAEAYPNSSGVAKTTRYWDCCKVSCSWSANTGAVSGPVRSCRADGHGTADDNAQSGCNGGNSYVCNDQQPFVVDGKAYGFAAGNVNGTGGFFTLKT